MTTSNHRTPSSPTDHVLSELQLFGYRPFDDQPDPRPLPEGKMIAGAVVRCRHDRSWERSLVGSAAPIAAFVAITQAAGGTGQNPKRSGGPERQRRMAEPGYFASRCKARGSTKCVFTSWRAAENSRAQPLPARAACRPIAL